jgi:cytochrome c nitrite reductase small subunit
LRKAIQTIRGKFDVDDRQSEVDELEGYRWKPWQMACVVIVAGMCAGTGFYTFGYGKGLSYLSADPRACANCHIMQDYYDTWQKASHHHVAVCIDCHLPHDFVGKYMAKADNGFFHSLAFTLDNFHEPIQIKPRNRRITQNNCVACHQDTVHEMLPAFKGGEVASCIHCHADVGHGPQK